MDIGAILSKLKTAVPGGVLEKNRFGRSEATSLWIDSRKLPEVAAFLKSDPELLVDWLENLSAIQMDKSIVLTYFLRSFGSTATLILRVTVEPGGAAKEATAPSVFGVWAMAQPFEREIQELFGVVFTQDGISAHPSQHRLPQGWNGYPLRKTYVFPMEFLGISHARRPVGAMGPEGNA